MIDFDLIWNSVPSLLQGVILSLQISFLAASLGLVFGTFLALAETTKVTPLNYAVIAYVTFFRGTPMLVQILFVYYVLPQFGLMIPPFWAASIAIGLNSAAYISQSIRSGINAVPKGQFEAAKTLGLSHWTTMRAIVLPQAFRVALPALGNEFITLIKDSSLASVIGVMELSKEASIIRSRTYDPFSILLAVSFIYLTLTGVVSLLMNKIEKGVKADVYS